MFCKRAPRLSSSRRTIRHSHMLAHFPASCRGSLIYGDSPALGKAVHVHVLHPVLRGSADRIPACQGKAKCQQSFMRITML